jgi:general secretion pathway protein A
MIEEHWGLHHSPFRLDPDPRLHFESAGYREGLARLLFAVRELRGGITLLTGEIGCGKTTLIRGLLRALPPDRFQAVLLAHPALPVGQLLAAILRLFGQKRVRGGKAEQIAVLHETLRELHDKGRAPVLAVDEAQLVDRPQLEELRLLTNLESETEKVLHLILVGQPEMAQRVTRFPALAQRVVMRFHLRPLSLEETERYVVQRLQAAGVERRLFTEAAVSALHRTAGGVPRLLNTIAAHALFLAAAARHPEVDVSAVAGAAQTLGLPGPKTNGPAAADGDSAVPGERAAATSG